MLGTFKKFFGLRSVAVILLFGMAILVFAAWTGGASGQILAAFVAMLVVVIGLAVMFVAWIQRMNEDIDSSRTEIRQDLEAAMEEYEDEG
jgi:O-antigen/teichoic acid export membrane protein